MLTEVGLDESSILKIKVDPRTFSDAFFERTCNMQHELALIDGASATENGLKTGFLGLVEFLYARIVWNSFIRVILSRQPAPRLEDILFSGAVWIEAEHFEGCIHRAGVFLFRPGQGKNIFFRP